MVQYLSILLFLVVSTWQVFATTLPKVSRVLVLGGTGRVGSQVVSRLLNQGIETNVLVRDLQAARSNPLLTGANLLVGDVNNIEDLSAGCQSCQAVIAVQGMRPPRFSRITDLFLSKTRDANHPYNVNFLAVKKLLAAMEKQKVNKIVRITGALVGQSPFNFFLSLFNLLLSFTVKWHEFAEIAIRTAGVDYTIIRPPGIRDSPSVDDQNQDKNGLRKELYLYDETTKNTFKPGPGVISKHDLADLCVLSLLNPQLSKVTAIVGSRPGKGFSNWSTLLQNTRIHADQLIGKPSAHYRAGTFYILLLGSIGIFVSTSLWKVLHTFFIKSQSWKRFAIPLRL